MSALVHPLAWDRVDLVGDVHGEIDALTSLLGHLGCDPSRARVDRPLVFVGDLIDRGPDSIAVVELVQHLVESGVAQVVLGNHELNVLADERKEGNGWILEHADHWWLGTSTVPFSSRRASHDEQQRIRAFLSSLPLALESAELRVIHAAWDPRALEHARRAGSLDELRAIGRAAKPPAPTGDEPTEDALRDRRNPVAFHAGLAALQVHEQNTRPEKILTSGAERPIAAGTTPRFLGGQWRMLERDPWWERDADPRPVVFGHYWRRRPGCDDIAGKADRFVGIDPARWFGQGRNAFCIDYSVGRRYESRHRGGDLHRDHGLGALRWPERELVFDDGARLVTAG